MTIKQIVERLRWWEGNCGDDCHVVPTIHEAVKRLERCEACDKCQCRETDCQVGEAAL